MMGFTHNERIAPYESATYKMSEIYDFSLTPID